MKNRERVLLLVNPLYMALIPLIYFSAITTTEKFKLENTCQVSFGKLITLPSYVRT